jgi:IclR family acetate operon transcriptional repressor
MEEESALLIIASMYMIDANQANLYTKSEFIEIMHSSRMQGYAIDDEEDTVSFRCVAAPIFNFSGDPIAAISISVPTTRVSLEELNKIGNELKLVCNKLS